MKVTKAPPKKEPPKKKKKKAAEPVPDESGSDSEEEEMKVAKAPPKKEEPAKAAAGGEEEWADVSINCLDCQKDFDDTAADQEFRWDKGFTDAPKRCKECRFAKKQRMDGEKGKDGKGKGKGKDGKGKGKDGKGKGKDGKKGGGICFKFQAGNCSFTDCKFSHTT